ncbi:MAG: hypothetical protein IT323_11435 [Anaerolineae bacterium]|nr:hypothetical protein [Anaerolineae bacterium]
MTIVERRSSRVVAWRLVRERTPEVVQTFHETKHLAHAKMLDTFFEGKHPTAYSPNVTPSRSIG